MTVHDVVVVGGGVSGLSFAFRAAKAGRQALVLEREQGVGGCLATHTGRDGYWFELGAHTCYRSYVATAALLEACGLSGRILPRARTHLRFLDGDRLLPGSNLSALLRQLHWGELLRALPRAFTEKKQGHTVYGYYARVAGRRNYGQVLGPMLSAVPSQSPDAFPADMLFKRRATRRKDLPRSFTLEGGLSTLAEALARAPGVTVATGAEVAELARAPGGGPGDPVPGGEPGYLVTTAAGERYQARVVVVATPPSAAGRLLRGVAPELATRVSRVAEAAVDSLGFTVPAGRVALPPSTFLIPRDDLFHSVVTRDSVPGGGRRAFTFHFKPGHGEEEQRARAARILGLGPGELEDVVTRRAQLPSPVLGHAEVTREVDRLLEGGRLCVVGNWFGGLSIEDCVERSAREWERVERLG